MIEFSFKCLNFGGLKEIELPYPEFDISNKQSYYTCGKHSPNKVNPEFVNAVIIKLQDTDKFDDRDRISVFLLTR